MRCSKHVFVVSIVALTVQAQLWFSEVGASYHEAKPATASSRSEGEVKKVDKDAGKLTVKHGPLVNLGMPAMTMVFRVKDSSMLDQVKVGDKVKFTADKINGAYVVTEIELSK